MSNFWTGFKAFLDSPLKFIADPPNTVIEYQVKVAATQGRTIAEIDQALSETGLSKGSVVGSVFDGVSNAFGFITRNLGLILVITLLIVVAWYILMFRKAVA
jgi:hypothetical protein